MPSFVEPPLDSEPAPLRPAAATPAPARQDQPLPANSVLLAGHAAEPPRLQALAADLTPRKRQEEAARWLAALVDSSDDAIVGKDLNGIINSWNKGAEQIFGYSQDEVLGKSVTILIPPDRLHEEERILRQLRAGQRVDHFETVRQRKDGRRVDISLTISPVRDSTGRIVGASKIARDITPRKRAERQQLALYELVTTINRATAMPEIFEAALEAICRCQETTRASILLYDAGGVMRFRAWRNLSDQYRQAVEGHSPWRPDEPDPQPVCITDVAQAQLDQHLRSIVTHEGIGALAFIPLISNQRLLGKFMLYYPGTHLFLPDQIRSAQTIASQVVFALERHKTSEELERLVTERTASLREAIARMEEFSYTVSHDLRSPLRAMQGYAEVLREQYAERLDADGQEFLERIIRSSARMNRLVTDVLIYSRASRLEMQLNSVSLDDLVRDVMRQYPELNSGHAQFEVQPAMPAVLGHEASLAQALANLLTNAVKFTRPGVKPLVQIRAERENGSVRLLIKDNGIGIDPAHQRRLFGLFERIHPEGKYEGTGIGLAIVRRTVERMGGKVGVESDGINGSQFWLELKAA